MTDATLRHISKLMSLVLRHAPDTIGVEFDAVVRTSDKQRFAFSDDGTRIRANQGHSLTTVDLRLEAAEPPALLYHGTASRFVDAIRAQGLRPGARQHVHLSRGQGTATAVGARHGRPVLLVVDAGAMHRQGHAFYLSANGVWLAGAVPAAFITFPPGP